MRRIEVTLAKQSLAEYTSKALREPLILMLNGHLVAAMISLDAIDWLGLGLDQDPDFQAIMPLSEADIAAGRSYTGEEIRQRLGLGSAVGANDLDALELEKAT